MSVCLCVCSLTISLSLSLYFLRPHLLESIKFIRDPISYTEPIRNSIVYTSPIRDLNQPEEDCGIYKQCREGLLNPLPYLGVRGMRGKRERERGNEVWEIA